MGTKRNQILEPSPPIARSILNKERGGHSEWTPSLKEPSLITITSFKINNIYTVMPMTPFAYKMCINLKE